VSGSDLCHSLAALTAVGESTPPRILTGCGASVLASGSGDWKLPMSDPRILYAARAGATSESEISTLANIYKFVLACHAKKEATRSGSPDDAKGSYNDRARHKYTK
jgi:hypothetical protein